MQKKTNKNSTKKPQANAAKNKRTAAEKSRPSTTRAGQSAPHKKSGQNGLFKFRRYKIIEGGASNKARHPKLIVSQEQQQVGFMGLTKSKKRGHHSNIELEVNPERGNKSKAYLRKEIRHDNIENFSEILDNYNLSESDKKKVIAYIESLKKKK